MILSSSYDIIIMIIIRYYHHYQDIDIMFKTVTTANDQNPQSSDLNIDKLKALIQRGIQAIPIDLINNEAVLMVGDTGVGKSTIMGFLDGLDLVVRFDGIKLTLHALKNSEIKIGHEKYSQTSIPTKVVIENMAFYDCPGFKDNKGEEYEISNSFFVQRLLNIYKKVKIVLVVDESHISEERVDKLPKLLRNLRKAFKTFQDIKDGCCLLINRADRDNTEQDYHEEILKIAKLRSQNGQLFHDQERKFLEYLVKQNRIMLFKQAGKENKDSLFVDKQSKNRILTCIKSNTKYVKSRSIENILSDNAKLAIRQLIDSITIRSNYKIELICSFIVSMYSKRIYELDKDTNGMMALKEEILKLSDEIKFSRKESIIGILTRELPQDKLQDFQEDFVSVMFFKDIYDKTNIYFTNLVNKIFFELSHLLTKLDQSITRIQKQNEEEKARENERVEAMMREQKKEQDKIFVMKSCEKIDDLRISAETMCSRKNEFEIIESKMRTLLSLEQKLAQIKASTLNLQSLNKQIKTEFIRIEHNYNAKKLALT